MSSPKRRLTYNGLHGLIFQNINSLSLTHSTSSHHTSLRYVLILSHNIRFTISSAFFCEVFRLNISDIHLLIRITCPNTLQSPQFNHPINICWGEGCKLWISSLRNFLHPPITSCLLRPNVLHSAFYAITLSSNTCQFHPPSNLFLWFVTILYFHLIPGLPRGFPSNLECNSS
jgi:hypothetical protein